MKKSRYTEEEIISILKQHEAGVKTADLCREHGISDTTFYNWRAKSGGLDVSQAQRLRQMEGENRQLKALVEGDGGCVEREDVERRVREGSADLGAAHLPVGAGLSFRPFAEDDYMAIVAENYTPSKRYFWRDVERLDFIELRCSGARAMIDQCRASGMTAKLVRSFSSVSTILAQAKRGRSFSTLPRLSVEQLPAGLRVVN